MKTSLSVISRYSGHLVLLVLLAALIAACGGEDPTPTPEPTATVAPATPTSAPTATVEPTPAQESQTESPLAQPESPLAQPASPITRATIPVPPTEQDAIAMAATAEAPVPEKGFGTLTSLVWSTNLNQAVGGVQTYLVKADEVDGQFLPPAILRGPKETDVYGNTNAAGQVQLEKIPPGHYYMMVWTVYNWLDAFSSTDSDAEPTLITINDGDRLNMGVQYTSWP